MQPKIKSEPSILYVTNSLLKTVTFFVPSNVSKPSDETKHYFVSSDARLFCHPGPVGGCLCSSWWLHWSWGHVQEYAGIYALPLLLIGEIEIVWQMHPETMHHAKMAANMAKKFAFEQVGRFCLRTVEDNFFMGVITSRDLECSLFQ